jgi:hypothetical protein
VLEDANRIKRALIAKFFVESSKSQIRIKEWTPTKRDIKRYAPSLMYISFSKWKTSQRYLSTKKHAHTR